ncbi:MAG: alcohol dehydrogenase [Acidimicrobiaceae bacterium]|jgi:L-iditol 2-dehydrogenase|nr:alcohol dehydrogenase [Acidimicrobiaceae bacterium]
MPVFNGIVEPLASSDHCPAPIHEIVGEVMESASEDFKEGQRVVGTLDRNGGLAEVLLAEASKLMPVPDELDDVEAVAIQSVATVVRAASHFPDVRGLRAAVIGAGPCGLVFCHILKQRGAAHVSAIDPVDRAETALSFGADDFFQMTSSRWLTGLSDETRPQIIVEAVGHQQVTIHDAVSAVADYGFVFGFGAPDDPTYSFPYEQLYDRNLTISSGRTLGGWQRVLREGAKYLLEHREDFATYVSHVLPVSDAQAAYSLYARPQFGRLKVALVSASTASSA